MQALLLLLACIASIRSSMNIRSIHSLDGFVEEGIPPAPPVSARDRRDVKNFWEHPASNCLHIDSVCRRRRLWFYRTINEISHQPSLLYWQGNITQSHGYGDVSKVKFNVSSAVRDIEALDSCPYSTVENHLIIQSAYNDMMGEFYSRTLLGLNQWLLDYPIESREQVQMYPHFVKSDRRMLVGHRMFLGGLPNNDIYRSFNDFVRDGRCQCFKKLIFCGYSRERHSNAQLFPEQNFTDDQANKMFDVIKPSGKIDNPKTQCGFATDRDSLLNNNCAGYRRLRNTLHKVFHQKVPSLDEMIRTARREILLGKGAISFDDNGVDVFKWKIVGLAKRTVSDTNPTERETTSLHHTHIEIRLDEGG